MKRDFRSGFATIVGRPNVGKSTLVNALVGQKIAITSDKPQTTRNSIRGVVTGPGYQVILIDTPGIHKPRHLLGEYMVKTALDTLNEVDVVIFMVDGPAGMGAGDLFIMDYLREIRVPKFLLINKVDISDGSGMNRNIKAINKSGIAFQEVLPISALTGENLDLFMEKIVELLPPGPPYYPEDMITDHPEEFIIAEIIREKAILLLEEEVPHSVAVKIREVTPKEDGQLLYVSADICVERDSQQGILIGKGGSMIKEIGRLSREELEKIMGSKMYIDLKVTVEKGWRRRSNVLRSLGYDEDQRF